MEKYKLLNSVMNPATSSDSASGKSKGTLLLSTSTQALYITKINTLKQHTKLNTIKTREHSGASRSVAEASGSECMADEREA